MSTMDLVFEGGGAKGMVFVGALQELFDPRRGHSHGRLLGTSAGAITAVFLAAGYTPDEMLDALAETDAQGKPVFASFLGDPEDPDEQAVQGSALRQLLRELNLPFVPDLIEDRLEDWLVRQLARHPVGRHLFSFVERGGWYSADPYVAWMKRKLDEGERDGQPRRFSKSTMKEFFDATQQELTLVAADTSEARLLLLNHRTAPDLPVVWAARMSMSVPLLWEEVVWKEDWGSYHAWDGSTNRLEPLELTDHTVVDGGLLSNFPIALFLADRDDVAAVVGPARLDDVLGLLIDEAIPVPNRPPKDEGPAGGLDLGRLRTYGRLRRLLNTATGAHDNMAIAAFSDFVVRLPAGGYDTTQFDMTPAEREALVGAGRQAMADYLAGEQETRAARGPRARANLIDLANDAASVILQR